MDTLTRKYKPVTFRDGALKQSNDALYAMLEGEGWKINISGEYYTPNGATTRKSLGSDDLQQITCLHDSLRVLSFDCIRNDQLVSLVQLQGSPDLLKLVTSASDVTKCKELSDVFVSSLSLEDFADDRIQGDYRSPAPPQASTKSNTKSSTRAASKSSDSPSLGWIVQRMPASGWLALAALMLLAFLLGLSVG